MSSAKEQRQAEYLRIVSETGSLVQARRRIGVTSKTVADWRRDPDFVEAVQDALDVANDAIRAKVREMALAGSESMLTLSMRVIEPALQPRAAQVALGVQVNNAQASRAAKMSDVQKVEWINRLRDDIALRRSQVVDAEVVEPLPAPSEGMDAPDHSAGVPGDLGEAAGPSLDDLL